MVLDLQLPIVSIVLYSQFILIIEEFMELRSIQRSNTVSSLSKKASIVPNKGKEADKENKLSLAKPMFSKHPAYQYIRSTIPSLI